MIAAESGLWQLIYHFEGKQAQMAPAPILIPEQRFEVGGIGARYAASLAQKLIVALHLAAGQKRAAHLGHTRAMWRRSSISSTIRRRNVFNS